MDATVLGFCAPAPFPLFLFALSSVLAAGVLESGLDSVGIWKEVGTAALVPPAGSWDPCAIWLFNPNLVT